MYTDSDPALRDFRRREDQRRAAAYAEFFGPVTAQLVDMVMERLGEPAGVVLDAGCGEGTLTAALAAVGWRPVPVDHSPAMAALTARRTRVAVVADATRLPLRTASVPAVVSTFLVPHLLDLTAGLAELRRVLCQGGCLVLATWETPKLSPFTGLAIDVVSALAPEQAGPAHELEQRSHARELASGCGRAGLLPQAIETVTLVAAMPSVHKWWAGLLAASCGIGALLGSLPARTRSAVRAAFEDEAATYRLGDGSVLVPASVVLLTARAVDR